MGCGDELKTRPFDFAIGLLPIAFMAAVFVLPVMVLVIEVWGIGFNSPNQIRVLLMNSLEISISAAFQAVISSVFALVIGIPLAGVLARYDFRLRSLMQALVLVPFVLPTLVTGMAFRNLFDGILEPGLILLWLAHVYVNLAVVVRVVGGAWESIDGRFELVGSSLGANQIQQFWRITFPLLRPAVMRAGALIFVFTFSSLGLVLLLGGNQSTLESQLLRQISLLVDFSAASITAAFQFLVSMSVLAIANIFRSRIPLAGIQSRKSPTPLVSKIIYSYLILLLLPLLSLLVTSFRLAGSFSTNNWQSILGDPKVLEAAAASIQIASLTALLAVSLGIAAAVASRGLMWRKLASLMALPLAVSSVTVGLGLLLAVRSREILPIPDWLLPSVAHSLVALPFVSAILIPAVRAVDENWFTLAASLGANRFEVHKVVLAPVLDRLVPVSLTLAIAISLGEFGAASFLADAERPTLSVLLLQLATKPAESAIGMATAIAVLLGLISLLLTFIVQKQEQK